MKLFSDFKKNEICGLTEQVKSLYIKELFEKQNKSVLLVTSSLYEANKFYQDLTNYTDEVLLFPMDDFLTSEAIAASPELKVNRLETINEILLNNKKIVITNLMGFLRFLPPEELFETKKINLTVNNEYNISNLKEKLFELGYKKEVTVSKTGEMAVRGFVLDIFPISSNNPIRIEFWGDQIESIREFDVNTQLTINNINNVQISSITEFLIDKPLDNFNIKQRDLIKYIKPKSIANFLDGYVIFNDYEQLKITYSNLIEEIHNYSLSENLPSNTKFMFDFNELEDKIPDIKYFSNFDNHITSNLESYNSFPLDKFPKDKDGINKALTSYLKKYHKVYLLCDSNKNINKLIDYLENPNIV
jgi:transcription-repair coupling factor (superfamily II helicase)